MPFLVEKVNVWRQMVESLVDDRPASDVGWHVSSSLVIYDEVVESR